MSEGMCSECRRTFLARAASLTGVLAGSALLSSTLTGCETYLLKSAHASIEVDVSAESALASVGGGIKKTFPTLNGGSPVMIIRLATEKFLVLTTICPHQGCQVYLPGARGPNIYCPCHGSQFSPTTGAVLRGPASVGLRSFPNSYDATSGMLTITS